MRNIFALVGLTTIAFVGLGWYLDWYRLSRQPASTGATNTTSFKVDLNPSKITEDLKRGIERGGEIVEHLSKDSGTNQQTTTNTEAPKPEPTPNWLTPPATLTQPQSQASNISIPR
ncbi:MAG: hypothetical protein K8T89_03380 [Planctomycetes bacterium]|nr:hypothetical protein [Planctomycetota bacterium]